MSKNFNTSLVAVVAATLAATVLPLTAPALAGDLDPKIAVPSTGGNGIGGCWTADRKLYGPYRLHFCLDSSGGSYRVTGGGLNCNADLSWRKSWKGYRFSMDQATCGNGTDWTADSFSCTVRSQPMAFGMREDDDGSGMQPKIAVPSPRPTISRLDCRYQPSVAGYPIRRFVAYRE